MAGGGDWREVEREILSKLDIENEYAAMGLRFHGDHVSHSGWRKCHAMGREDRNPSAAVNVAHGPMRGLYRDLGGMNEVLSLFNFAVRYAKFTDWKEARKHFADKAGVKIGTGLKARKNLSDGFEQEPWNETLVHHWCENHKKGVTVESFRDAGGVLGKWPKPSKKLKNPPHLIVTLPVFGDNLTADEPIGWVMWHRGGRKLPIYQGKGLPYRWEKMKTIYGGKSGWMGQGALTRLGDAKYVWKVEGPPDMLALSAMIPPDLRHEHVCITNSGGCSEIPRAEMLACLEGKTVYCIGDCDNPGQGIYPDQPHRIGGVKLWSREIARVAFECRTILLPYPIEEKHGKDFRDWKNDGGTWERLLQMAATGTLVLPPPSSFGGYSEPSEEPASTPIQTIHGSDPAQDSDDADIHDPAEDTDEEPSEESPTSASTPTQSTPPASRPLPSPPPKPDRETYSSPQEVANDERICESIGIDVVGENETGGVMVFSEYHRKTRTIREVTRLTPELLLQIGGPKARSALNESTEFQEGRYTMQQIKRAIAMLAGYRHVSESSRRGSGVWQSETADGRLCDTSVLVNSGEAACVTPDGHIQRIYKSHAGGLLVDLGAGCHWYDYETLQHYVSMARNDRQWVKSVIDETNNLFSRWTWEHQDTDPVIITGMLMATWVQTWWKYRPMIAITGESNSGKSTLMQVLGGEGARARGLFGELVELSSASTEAGIRQTASGNAKVLLIDEFEDSKERTKVLTLFRTASRGALKTVGTTSGKAESHGLRHIPWVAAIEVGLKREPDRNRFIMLNLKRPPANQHGKLVPPSPSWLVDHGQKLLAIALVHIRQAVELAVELKSTHVEGVDKRVIESYAVPAAMLSVCNGLNTSISQEFLRTLLSGVERVEQGRRDVDDLISDILTSQVRLGGGMQASVSQIISQDSPLVEHMHALEGHGVGIVDRDGQQMLYIVHRVVCRMLLRGTGWENQSIDQILKRYECAVAARHRIAGHNNRGVALPMDRIREQFLSETAPPIEAVGTTVNGVDF